MDFITPLEEIDKIQRFMFAWIGASTVDGCQLLRCSDSYSPAGGIPHLLTANLAASKQSFNPGPEHLQHINIPLKFQQFPDCYTSASGHTE